jgi:hypothetical protein
MDGDGRVAKTALDLLDRGAARPGLEQPCVVVMVAGASEADGPVYQAADGHGVVGLRRAQMQLKG